ncbi:MAG: hypothetical protein J6T10_22470 [Methanobrevibacter sp.]|nr:hypothetical protein [Methanobrevibacter sp.]
MPKHPCVNCKYFNTCGNTNRTVPCNGRELKGKQNKPIKVVNGKLLVRCK